LRRYTQVAMGAATGPMAVECGASGRALHSSTYWINVTHFLYNTLVGFSLQPKKQLRLS